MRIAIVLFDGFTALDAVGPYEVFRAVPDAHVRFVAREPGEVRNESGTLGLTADVSLAESSRPDVVVVPGGPGQQRQMSDGPLHQWLRAAETTATWMTSVCTGSLILAAAGLLDGRRATTHWSAVDRLPALGATHCGERVVFDGKYVTAAGVSAGIDMALTLAGKLAGDTCAQAIQLGIEYDPLPPYNSGSPAKAPTEVTEMLTARAR